MPNFWSIDGAQIALANAGLSPNREGIGNSFEQYVHSVYKANGAAFAVIAARCRVFSQARFQYQKLVKGRPGDMFSKPQLGLLERPWPNGTTGEMLTHMDVDVAMAGNSYFTVADEDGRIGVKNARNNPFIARLRPDWVQLILASPSGNMYWPDVRVIGLWYSPPGNEPMLLRTGDFSHYSPYPDPDARFRGMSWLTPCLNEVKADNAITAHKTGFLRNGATPNLAVVLSEEVEDDEFIRFVDEFRKEYEGTSNAYKTLILAGGADVKPLSVDFKALDLKSIQGGLETRMCAAGGIHPTIVGLSEGLEGSSLNAGNYGAARRIASDMTVRGLWAMAASSLEVLVPFEAQPNTGARLVVDDRDIPFLREDAKDEAEIFSVLSTALNMLVTAGWEPDDAVKAAKARDVSLLIGKHSGLPSVQLQQGVDASGNGSMPTVGQAGGNGNARREVTPASGN